jgi:hypothetical protein
MLMRQLTALTLAIVLACFAGPLAFAQQPSGRLAGTAKDEAKKPYSNYTVRARAIAARADLDPTAKFVLPNLDNGQYLVELVKANKVVCTEGPFTLTATAPAKDNVNISCGVPNEYWLLAAAAAGVTAAIVTRQPASGAQ